MVNRIVDKSDPKYIIALQFLNHILTNINKPNINDILDFKDITRQEILKQENLNKLNEMESEVYKYFDKYCLIFILFLFLILLSVDI